MNGALGDRVSEGRASENQIVVGVDGSEPAAAALRWALTQAELTGSTILAVIAWDFPAFYSWEGGSLPPEDFEDAATKALDETVERVLAETGSQVPVDREVIHGHAAHVLLKAAGGARMLVVGGHAHGGFLSTMLGSVSQRCAHHSKCPVVIVPG